MTLMNQPLYSDQAAWLRLKADLLEATTVETKLPGDRVFDMLVERLKEFYRRHGLREANVVAIPDDMAIELVQCERLAKDLLTTPLKSFESFFGMLPIWGADKFRLYCCEDRYDYLKLGIAPPPAPATPEPTPAPEPTPVAES
jgi:hypothetical protein